MAKNINSVQAGTVQQNGVNDPQTSVYRGKNQFPQSFQHPSTCQYGVVDPVAVAKCEPGDIFPYKFVTDLNTFTMKSPLKSKVRMYSAAFKVPMEAIYPRNYDILFPIPNKGDDAPQIDNETSARSVWACDAWIRNVASMLISDSLNNVSLRLLCRYVFMLESVLSDGSIFSKVNIHLNAADLVLLDGSSTDTIICFDDWFDLHFVPYLREVVTGFIANDDEIRSASGGWLLESIDSDDGYPTFVPTFDETSVGKIVPWETSNPTYFISFPRFIELLRTGEWIINKSSAISSYLNDSVSTLHGFRFASYVSFPYYLNIESVVAYQLACAHFFNNPKVDYIFDCKKWLANMETLWRIGTGSSSLPTFEYNGTLRLYDILSSRFLNDNNAYYFGDTVYDELAMSSFWLNLFGFTRSLRYGDYFTGSRPEPIAPGDIDTDLTPDGSVNSLQLVQKLQLTRLLNKVNIAGPRKDDYLKVVFGQALPDAPTDVPIRLSVEEFDVSGFEVNNTGSDQLSDESQNITTTNLRLDESRFMFEVHINEPCWLVAVQYFDAHRIYSKTIDRMAFHFDRYDDFIPDLQFVGDQEVKQQELLGVNGTRDLPFAYNLRYMEYKQRVSYASGGFIRRLKSWAMITDNNDGNPSFGNITPEYIRSSPSEFDRFYKSLTGYSLGSRFHFITFNTNVVAPYRQMVFAPEILA